MSNPNVTKTAWGHWTYNTTNPRCILYREEKKCFWIKQLITTYSFRLDVNLVGITSKYKEIMVSRHFPSLHRTASHQSRRTKHKMPKKNEW